MGWLSGGTKGSDGDYSHHDKHDSIPKGLIPGLAKGEAKACENASKAELRSLAAQHRQRNEAARRGWNRWLATGMPGWLSANAAVRKDADELLRTGRITR